MEWSFAFFSSLLMVIFIDLILSGDNAVVIAMAAHRLPEKLRRPALICGVVGAVVMRVLITVFVLFLLSLPWLRVVGGLILLYIAYSLLLPEDDSSEEKYASSHVLKAICIIAIADITMSLDNMIGVAGAANGDAHLVIFGLILSIPIMVGCSSIILKFMDKFPWIVYVGAGILVYTAIHMMLQEPNLQSYTGTNYMKVVCYLSAAAVVLGLGWVKRSYHVVKH